MLQQEVLSDQLGLQELFEKTGRDAPVLEQRARGVIRVQGWGFVWRVTSVCPSKIRSNYLHHEADSCCWSFVCDTICFKKFPGN